MEGVITAQVTRSVRDAHLGGLDIAKNDFIGFVGKSMKVSCKKMTDAATSLLSKMLGDEAYLITAFVGKDASSDDVAVLEDWIGETYPDVEFYTVDGGQDVYDYIIILE